MNRLDADGSSSARRFAQTKAAVAIAILSVALLVAGFFSATQGALPLGLARTFEATWNETNPMYALLWEVRYPRIFLGVVVGASLGVAGLVMQTVVRNPLADPSLIGVSAGAGVAALLAILLAPEATYLLAPIAFLGATLAAATILGLSWTRSSTGPLRIILSGVAVQAILFAVIGLLTFLYADRAPSFVAFTVGSLAGAGWRDVRMILPPAVLGLVVSLLALRRLDLLLLDDDTSAGIGLPVRVARLLFSTLASLLAAAAVSVAGLVGFVGLVVPNAARLVVGPTHRFLLPTTALGGALLVVVADTAARTLFAPLELPVGSLLALLGGPYFLLLLWRRIPG